MECDVKRCVEFESKLLSRHKNIRRFVIGKTELCRSIVAYSVCKMGGLLLCGAFHGMERLTAQMLYRFLDEVCTKAENDHKFAKALEKTGLVVVPMVNPDGVEISVNGERTALKNCELVSECLQKSGVHHTKWQANSRGVDINHNFDADFAKVKENERKMGINAPAHTRYGGEFPESERETRAIATLCRSYYFSLSCALHTQGREIYYDFGENTPSVSLDIAKKMANLSGYIVSKPQGIAVGGGFKDWFIDYFRRPSFTLEIGLGENPLPPEVAVTEYDRVSPMLWCLLDYAIKNAP